MSDHEWQLVETTKEFYYGTQKKDGSYEKTPVSIQECKYCYVNKRGPYGEPGCHHYYEYYDFDGNYLYLDPGCIKLPIFFEALERASRELWEKYQLATEWVWQLYYRGENDFFSSIFFPGEVNYNRLDLCRKMMRWVEDGFIEQYKIEKC